MLNPALIVMCKEIRDSGRDVRSVVSAVIYALMGPAVVWLISLSGHGAGGVLIGMMSVFTLVAAFAGGMNVAMDSVAGERERRSLLPLLLNPVRRLDLVAGKWLAICFFAAAGLAVNLAGFAFVLTGSGMLPDREWLPFLIVLTVGLLPLALFAASLQLLISTVCRSVKEAQTYLSMAVFLPMGVGMFLVFFPAGAKGWARFLPLAGQQLQITQLLSGNAISPVEPLAVACFTTAAAVLGLLTAANRLQRDEIIYGN